MFFCTVWNFEEIFRKMGTVEKLKGLARANPIHYVFVDVADRKLHRQLMRKSDNPEDVLHDGDVLWETKDHFRKSFEAERGLLGYSKDSWYYDSVELDPKHPELLLKLSKLDFFFNS